MAMDHQPAPLVDTTLVRPANPLANMRHVPRSPGRSMDETGSKRRRCSVRVTRTPVFRKGKCGCTKLLAGYCASCGKKIWAHEFTCAPESDVGAGNVGPRNGFYCAPCAREWRTEKPTRSVIPESIKRAVIERDGMICQICGVSVERLPKHAAHRMHFDHIQPWAVGGPESIENIRVSCAACNLSRAKPKRTRRVK